MNIAIIGTGYVGLVSGTCFAEMGNQVTCVDVDVEKVKRLRAGEIPIYEPGLEPLFARNRKQGRLRFTTNLAEAALPADVIFLALPTPPGEDGAADLSYVLDVANELARLLADEEIPRYRVIVNKSTVPVGTADALKDFLRSHGLALGETVDVLSNPEFLREGEAVDDFMKPDRVVVGTSSEHAAEVMTRLYEPFLRQGNPILVVDERSAEMIKYAANALLATRISFMNEVANLCERVGANVDEVRLGVGKDHRIGPHFLYAGIGLGGSCFPKDVQALTRMGLENGSRFRILESVLAVNDDQPRLLVDRVVDRFGGHLACRKIAVWGLAFKPNTDDVREAPAHTIIQGLLDRGANIHAFDPEATDSTREQFGSSISYGENMYEVLRGSNALVICTEWPEFRRPEHDRMRDLLARPIVFDGRNLYDPQEMAELGFEYSSIGRASHAPSREEIRVSELVTQNGQAH